MRWQEIMEGSSDDLFHQYGGKFMKFDELPLSAQTSLLNLWSEHFDLEDAEFIASYQSGTYGYVMIPTDELIKVCWNAPDNEMRDDYKDWQEYHDTYWKREDDSNYANHLTEMRPVLLDDSEGILDGWHRLHWYYRNGVVQIPAVLILT